MNLRTVTRTALAAGCVSLIAGCSGGASGSSSAATAAAAPSAAKAAAGAAATAATAGAVPATVSDPAALILTGDMTLSVASSAAVNTAATRATGIADGSGGRVDADSRTSPSRGQSASATLVLRVPNPALSEVITRLAALGTVRSQELQTKDVTAQVADVTSRVTSARAAIAGLDRLYARASTVRDLITVETSLAARQSNLEALEAQQRALAAQTSLATLTLSIDVRAHAVTRHRHHHNGFTSGLRHGWRAFTATARGIAAATGAVLPFAVVLLLLGAVGILVLRRRRPRSAPAADPNP